MKAIILARVSTEEQKEAGNSLPAQVERLKKYCKGKGFEGAKTFSIDESAYKTKRDDFDKALEYLKSTAEKVCVCFDKVDRFSRNVFDKRVASLYDLAMRDKIELHFASDNLVITPDISATEKFQFGINLGLAKYYSDAISDSVKRAYETKIKKGEWIGRAIIGYVNVGDEKNRKDIVPDPLRSHYIMRIFTVYATGNYSLKQIRDEMEKSGLTGTIEGNPISTSMVYTILKNPFYCGLLMIKGKLYPHKYQTLISKELFNKCQEVMAGYHKKPFKYASKPFVFRGLIKCADPNCGCTITPEIQKGHNYYHCTNYKRLHKKVIFIREEELLASIYKVLESIKLPDNKIKKITEELRAINESKNAFHQTQLSNLRKEYDLYQRRIDKSYELLLDGSITKDMFNKKLNEFKDKQTEIADKTQEYTNADENFYLTANAVLNLAKRAKDVFISSEVAEKRQLLNFLLQNCELQGKKLEFSLRKPFDAIAQYSHTKPMLRR